MSEQSKPKFSFSQLHAYDTCPKKYHYAYIVGLPPRYTHNFAFGTTLHSVMRDFYSVVKHDRENPPMMENTTKEFLFELLDQHWITKGYMSEEHLKQKKEDAKKILDEFFEKNKNDFGSPLFLEKSFSLEFDDFILTGRFDRIDKINGKEVEIIDYKSSKSKKESDLKKDLQLSIYYFAASRSLNLIPTKLSFYFFGDNKKVVVDKSEKDLEKDEKKIVDLSEQIITQDFTADPDRFKCKYCDYKDICEDAI